MPGRCYVAPPRCSDKMQLRSAALLFVLLAAFITAAQAQEKRIVLEHPLVLADGDGKTVTSDDFPEKFLLVYFGYTHCADQCPTALSAMVEALAEIGPAADYIQPLFVTVDPERDRGVALNEFTAAFDKQLVGLTGSQVQIAAAAEALGVEYRKVLAGNEDYVIDHSSVLSLIGPDRRNAVTFAFAEPYLIAAKLIAELDRGGVALGKVNNLRAYR
ncbi:MAG: SCO family protein [Alphaproteobacteria bacterium]|nr:MAG: SCO family protein [Alphaproteobacteria bacterium]